MLETQYDNPTAGKLFKTLLYFAFLVSGIITVLIGQILPTLSTRLKINDQQAGYFFVSQFSGSLLGTFLTQLLIKKFGFKTSTIIGLVAMGIAIFGLNSSSFEICLLSFFFNGVGIGITLPSINMLMVELNPLNVTSSLNFLNFFWGIGAIFCKPFVDFTVKGTNSFFTLSILTLTLFATALALSFAKTYTVQKPASHASDNEKLPPIWTTFAAWLFAIFGFIHVGFESAMGGWITTYSNRLLGETNLATVFTPTFCYYLFFVIGRGISPLFIRFLSDNQLISVCLLLVCGGVGILISADSFAVLILGAAIAGIGTSAIFPTNISRFTKTFGKTSTSRATPIFICGTLGSMMSTFLIGYISESFNNLRLGMTVLLFSGLILMLIQILIYLNQRSKKLNV